VSEAQAPAPAGTVHDLGYKRYVGTRRPQSSRWRVIARNQMAMAWKTFWRYKLALFFAAATALVCVIILTIGLDRFSRGVTTRSIEDQVLGISFEFFVRAASVASLTFGAMVIAGDSQSGAFGFYFARPVRPIDYVVGKVAGVFFLMALLTTVGPLILVGVRIGMYADGDQMLARLDLLPRVIGIGLLIALAYTAVPLAFSSLVSNRRYALALWASYYLVFGTVVEIFGRGSWVAGLDIRQSSQALANSTFDLAPALRARTAIDGGTAATMLAIQIAIAFVVIYVQVRRARESGVVGSS
jgi:ABC-2 type transport system permease protein